MLGGCIFHYYWSKLVISNNTNKEDKVENVSANKKKAIVIKSHKKRKVVRSEAQALSQLAGGMNILIESQAEQHKEQMEFEKERDRAFLEFKREEAEKNRRLELEIAKIFASSMNNSQQQRHFRYTPFNQTSLFNTRFNTLQIFKILQVPLHILHHHRFHLLSIIMQTHTSR